MLLNSMEIVKKYQQQIPVRIKSLASELGANVHEIHTWDKDVSGMIKIDKNKGGFLGYAIYINSSHHPNRKRFTIAHEIAHIVLHSHLIGDGITTNGLYRSGFPTHIEWAANRLAGSILMPPNKVKECINGGVESVSELAEIFKVSKSAMTIQLDYAWALEWD